MHGVRKLRAYSFGHLPGAVFSGEEDQDHTLAAIVNLRVSNFGDPPIYSIAVLLNADPIFVAARMIPITHLSLSIGSNGKKLGPQYIHRGPSGLEMTAVFPDAAGHMWSRSSAGELWSLGCRHM